MLLRTCDCINIQSVYTSFSSVWVDFQALSFALLIFWIFSEATPPTASSFSVSHIPAVSDCFVLLGILGFGLLLDVQFCYIPETCLQGFFGLPLRGRFSTVLLRRYLTMMLCTVDLGILSSSPMAPSDLPSFQRSTTRCRCTTSCSLVFWKTPAAIGPPVAPAAASVGADKRQTVVEARRVKRGCSTIM